MAKLRKMLGSAGSPYIVSLMRLIETQSKAAIAYDRLGTGESAEVYDRIAAQECAKMEAALRVIAVEDEPNPAKIKWNC